MLVVFAVILICGIILLCWLVFWMLRVLLILAGAALAVVAMVALWTYNPVILWIFTLACVAQCLVTCFEAICENTARRKTLTHNIEAPTGLSGEWPSVNTQNRPAVIT